MKRVISIISLICLAWSPNYAQELFPLSEPASNMPANVWGLRIHTETYKEINQWRNQSNIRLMYGVTPKLTTYLTAFASNHHGDKLPSEFPYHNTPERGAIYPYKLNGGGVYAKYRFFTYDRKNEHLRIAAYGEATYVNVSHHEAEPNVSMGDNAGFSGGLIFTYLKNKGAVSLTLGGTFPTGYTGVSPDPVRGLPDIPEFVKYGNALDYKLSFGYLVYPKVYKNFDQPNFNVYLEFTGKYYDATIVRVFDGMPNEYWLQNNLYPPALQKGAFVDISPGIQAIIKSNLRIDLSCTFPMLGMSYAKLYPVFVFGIQRYFF